MSISNFRKDIGSMSALMSSADEMSRIMKSTAINYNHFHIGWLYFEILKEARISRICTMVPSIDLF